MHKVKKYKIGRRLGAGVYEKCQTRKFAMSEKRGFKKKRRFKQFSDYAMQLMEKQKVRFAYGLSEKQLSNYVKKALSSKNKTLSPAMVLFKFIESRIDNTVYRSGFAKTRRMARQMVSHGHFLVNGKRTTVPSYLLKKGDVISVREGSKTISIFTADDFAFGVNKINWLTCDTKKKEVKISGSASVPDSFFNFQVVVQYYTR